MSLAPAVSRDGFAFAGGDLFAEASGHNRHRRASPAELKAHFASGSDRDHPAHWFEAQLLHYGLQPSKTKAVARMRLYDAVKANRLSVPTHIRNLEADLKKQWTRAEREAKKMLSSTGGGGGGAGGGPSGSSKTAAAKATQAGTKRKAEESSSNTIDLTVSVGGVDIKLSTNSKTTKSSSSATTAASAAKKAKTTKTTAESSRSKTAAKETPKSKTTAKDTPKPKAIAKETPKPKAAAKDTAKPKATPKAATKSNIATSSAAKPKTPASTSKPKPAKTQTALRGGHSQGPGRGAAPSSSASSTSRQLPPNPRRARRSGAFAARGRIAAPTSSLQGGYGGGGGDFDAPPPPYSEYDDGGKAREYHYISSDDDDRHGYDYAYDNEDDDIELRPLGLLNGRYTVYSPDVTETWGGWADEDFSLVLTLRGEELWGRFDLGVVRGVLQFERRPYQSSHERQEFTWRGRSREGKGQVFDGNRNGGWLRFLGDGRIEGRIDYDYRSLDFQAERVPGQPTRSEIDAATLLRQWDAYNEEDDERYEQYGSYY